MNTLPVEADLFHADGRADMSKLMHFAILRTRLKFVRRVFTHKHTHTHTCIYIYIILLPTSHKTLSISTNKAERVTLLRKTISACG
jgi:hypothetical protein